MLRWTDNLIMQMTRDCNLNCKYCFQGGAGVRPHERITFEQFKQIVDSAIYNRCVLGTKDANIEFHFHGGEVTLFGADSILEMAEYINKRASYFRGVHFSIQTNGVLFDDALAKYFAENHISVGISFDGFKNDRMGEEATHKLIDKFIRYKKEYNLSWSPLVVLSRKNIKTWREDIDTFKDYCTSYGVNVICTLEEDDSLMPSPDELWDYWFEPELNRLADASSSFFERDLKIMVDKLLQDVIFNYNIEENPLYNKTGCFDKYCGHGVNMIAVDPFMKLHKCDKYMAKAKFAGLDEGEDLYKSDFLGMQQVKNLLNFYKEITAEEKKLHCDLCPANWICNGECQSYSISKYGKVTLNKNMCSLYLKIFDWVNANWVKLAKAKEWPLVGKVYNVKSQALKELSGQNLKIEFNEISYSFKVVSVEGV